MKKRVPSDKPIQLRLHRETLRHLGTDELRAVAGGVSDDRCKPPTWVRCSPPGDDTLGGL